jgi:uncharacterized protein (DUF983 family)
MADRLLVVRRVLLRRCPQCADGRLFRAFARLNGTCASCGLVYRREQGAQTGSMYLTAAVTEVFAAILIGVLWIAFDWSVARYLAVSVPLVLVFCVGFLPVAQAIWVGVEYQTDLSNSEPWARLQR